MDIIIFGNVTLDIICQTIDDVPRHESVSFDNVKISPGGCGSNVAYGLAIMGISTGLVCRVGEDEAGSILKQIWQKVGINLSLLKTTQHKNTAISIGLIDSQAQPRFIHTSGANATLTSADAEIELFAQTEAKFLHIAGFFVLPGLLDGKFPQKLRQARAAGITTSLDVVYSPRYWKVDYLWPCLPEIDTFMCNMKEANKLTGKITPEEAAFDISQKGARNIIIKLGRDGCYVKTIDKNLKIMAPSVDVVDTTGAGDAFAAGYLASLCKGESIIEAARFGNLTGSRMVTKLGAISGWEDYKS